jgi:tripartite-type tricarboxylate transporter receptor subunit TctC
MKKTITLLSLAAALCAVVLPGAASAQNYPTKPVRLVVGFSAGGPTDVIARIIAQDMTATFGQTVLVENKAGAASMIATQEVKRSARMATRCT